MADIDKLETSKDEAVKEARARLNRHDMAVQERKDAAHIDTVVAEKRDYALERKARYVFLNNRIDQLEGDLKMISREMSRREAEIVRARK